MFVPDATATHFGGGSTANAPLRYSIEILRATLKYWRKHYGIAGQIACYFLILAHHGFRLLVRGIKQSLGFGRSIESKYKLEKDFVCLRWLMTGKGVA
jgi:GT2 family glycosyltransferase